MVAAMGQRRDAVDASMLKSRSRTLPLLVILRGAAPIVAAVVVVVVLVPVSLGDTALHLVLFQLAVASLAGRAAARERAGTDGPSIGSIAFARIRLDRAVRYAGAVGPTAGDGAGAATCGLRGAFLHTPPALVRELVRIGTLAGDLRDAAHEVAVALCTSAVALRFGRRERVRYRGATVAPSTFPIVCGGPRRQAEEERHHADGDAVNRDPTRTLRNHRPSWALGNQYTRYLAW